MRTVYLVMSAANFAAALAFPAARWPFLMATVAFLAAAILMANLERNLDD